MKFKVLSLIVIPLFLFSCKSSKFATTADDYTKLNLNFTAEEISIIDQRVNISEENDIKLPVVSHPNQQIDFYPEFKQEYREIIKKTIHENLDNSSSRSSIITVYILEARKEFSANAFAEQEMVAIKLKLVIDINGEKNETIETGEFHRKSMDATYKKFEELYRKSLKEVTYNALKKTKH